MRALQRLAITRPVATAMFFLGVCLMGAISFGRLRVGLLPSIEYPRVTVATGFANAAPEEIENLITRPLSEAVGTVSGITNVQSESVEGMSIITLQFAWGTNVDFAVMEVREKIDLVRGLLPQDAARPIVTRFDPGQAPFMEIAFFPKGLEKPRDLRDFLHKNVKVFMDRVDGVAMVQLAGGDRREISVDVDPTSLVAHGLTLREIRESIAAANLNFPAGHIKVGSRDVLVRSLGEFRNVSEIGSTIVGRNEAGVPIQLSSVARITDSYRERTGAARYNGRDCVLASLYREPGKNAVDVAAQVRLEVEQIRSQFPREFEVTIVYDESRFIKSSISNVYQAIAIGGILAFCGLFLILRNLHSPFIVLTIVPVSILGTFVPMEFLGLSLNMMSLGGLELCVGMLFDSGNVVLAAIQRHSAEGLTRREAALRGVQEVSSSVTSAILTTIIVFVPIVFLKSVVGVVFAELAMTITAASLVNLVVALTLIPMLCALPLPARFQIDLTRYSAIRRAEKTEGRLTNAYMRLLAHSIDNPRKFWRIVFGCMAVAVLMVPFIRREFVPRVDRGEFEVLVRAPRGTSLAASQQLVAELEHRLTGRSDIEHVISRIGYEEDEVLSRSKGSSGTHMSLIRAVLRPDRGVAARDVVLELEPLTKMRKDVNIEFVVRSDVLSSILAPDGRSLTLDLQGDDLETLREIGSRIKTDLVHIQGLGGLTSSMEDQAREYHVSFDRDRLAQSSLTAESLAQTLKTAVKGSEASSLHTGDEEITIRVRVREEDRTSIEDIGGMRLPVGDKGGSVFLSQLARIEQGQGHTSILRSGPFRINRITAEVDPASINRVFSRVEDYLEDLKLPEGYSIRFAGERESIASSFRELVFALLLSVLLIYMLLAGQYESLTYPLLMLGTIPLILIGVAPALLVTGKSINISSFTGLILLVGIVVDNASLFYEYVHILREEGLDVRSSVMQAARIVFRPLLMNNGTNMLGMLPVALEIGEGAEFQSPLAIAVISGLAASVVLSLFVIPILFHSRLQNQNLPAVSAEAVP